jgi:CheY-like chemotaxis protein
MSTEMSCKSILLVEDDGAIRQTLKDVLEIEGYEVSTAVNGKDGEECLKTMRTPPCVILLDLMMPQTNGWQFLDFQKTSQVYRKIPVIICSAYEESAKSIQPAAFVPKPVQLEQLLGAVKAFCL